MKICQLFQSGALAALLLACGPSATPQEATTPSLKALFVYCSGDDPPYRVVEAPPSGCRALVAGADYADGRVLIGVKAGTSDADLQPALDAYHASVLSQPAPSQRLLQVPNGTVPQVVVGLARNPLITFAQPDLLEHPAQSVT